MSSVGSGRRMTRSVSRALSSDGSTAVGPEIPTRTLRSGSRARSTAASGRVSVARSARGSVAGSVAGSSRRTPLPDTTRVVATTYGDEGPGIAQEVAEAGTRAIETIVEGAQSTDIDGLAREAGDLSMIEEEEGALRDDFENQLQHDAGMNFNAAPRHDYIGLNLDEAPRGAIDMHRNDNQHRRAAADAAEDVERTYSVEDILAATTYTRTIASVPVKSWSSLDILKWSIIALLLSLIFADIYRGPLFGDNFDLLRWRSDVIHAAKNSTPFTSPDVGLLSRRFDQLEHKFQNLAYMPHTANTDAPRVHKINWFSPGLGAITAPTMSSPTKIMTRTYVSHVTTGTVLGGRLYSWMSTFLTSWYSLLGSKAFPPAKTNQLTDKTTMPIQRLNQGWSSYLPSWLPLIGSRTTPTVVQINQASNDVARTNSYSIGEYRDIQEALLPWHDIGDCWCAPSTRGKLQLAVLLPRSISPSELVVEHVHKSELRDIGNAPKEVELWVQVLHNEVRDQIAKEILKLIPDIYKSASQRGKGADTIKALDESFVPIGRWTYDINGPNNVQSFPVLVDLAKWKHYTRRAVVRVNSNWGSTDATCLYRVKLHGADPAGPVVYNDLEEI